MVKYLGGDLTIIILAAGMGRQMRIPETKSLIPLPNGDTLLNYQINTLRKKYPKAEIIVVVGYQADKIMKIIPNGVKIVENEHYDTTNTVRSIAIALRIVMNPKILIIHNDLIFNPDILIKSYLIKKESAGIVDTFNQINPKGISVTITNGFINHFAYNLPIRWSNILFLRDFELQIFRQLCYDRDKERLFSFEMLNKVIDMGGKIKAIYAPNNSIMEINTLKDLENMSKIKEIIS